MRSALELERVLQGSTAKVFGSRACEPKDTLARITPQLSSLGITRVANITGLDRIGVPVFITVRPNGRALAVSQGKGLTADAARVSSIMESIEHHHAEYADCLVRLTSFAELSKSHVTVAPEHLPLCKGSLYASPRTVLPWIEAFDLTSGRPAWVPFELVHLNLNRPPMPGSGCFMCTSNGLASGNTPAEAILHGLLEVIERDALAVWEHSPEHRRDATRIDLHTVDDFVCRDLLDRFASANISVLAWQMTAEVRLPVIRVIIFDPAADVDLHPFPACFGAGCALDPATALMRALLEAAQTRVTVIAGSRDDLSRERYRAFQSADSLEIHRRLCESSAGPIDFRTQWAMLPKISGSATIEDDLSATIARLKDVGFPHVLAVDLSRDENTVSVVRTIVPGLEGATESPTYRPGARAIAPATLSR